MGSKLTRAILLCSWERHFTALSSAWWSWQAVLNFNHISIKLQADSNILVSPEAGHASVAFLRVRRIKCRDKNKKNACLTCHELASRFNVSDETIKTSFAPAGKEMEDNLTMNL